MSEGGRNHRIDLESRMQSTARHFENLNVGQQEIWEKGEQIRTKLGEKVSYKGKTWVVDSVVGNVNLGIQVLLRLGDRTELVGVHAVCLKKLLKQNK